MPFYELGRCQPARQSQETRTKRPQSHCPGGLSITLDRVSTRAKATKACHGYTRMRCNGSRVAILFISVLFDIFTLVGRHLAGAAARTIMIAFCRPHGCPPVSAFCATVVVTKLHYRSRK